MYRNIFLLLLLSVSVYQESSAQTVPEQLDNYFKAANEAGAFNGSVLVTRGQEVLLRKGYGYKNLAAKSLNDAQTIYQIGSVTKQFTSAIVMKLVEEGKLSLADKLDQYFPSLPGAGKITIEQLLSHTAGVYNYTNDTTLMFHHADEPLSQAAFLKMIAAEPSDFEPGSQFSYSNSGYMLLGYIIEKITGKKYETVVREQIFKPLKMEHAGFDFTHLQSKDKATGYETITAKDASPSVIVDSSVSYAAGAIYASLDDMRHWNEAIDQGRLLSTASWKNTFTTRLSGYALGWMVSSIDGKELRAHNGGIHGFISHNSGVPADSIHVVLLSNDVTTRIDDAAEAVYAILYKHPYITPKATKEIQLDEAVLQQYTGSYELAPSFLITVSLEGGQLKAQATGQPQFDLFAASENMFFLKVVDASVEFVKDKDGAVTQLILHQNGQHIPGNKVK